MADPIPELHKIPGVCYAWTEEQSALPCVELPVIDITHPAFAFDISDSQLDTLIDNIQRASQIPPAALQAAAQQSLLLRGIVESGGTYTTGMMTYLNKLEPQNLGEGYAGPLDRQWAASLTPVTFRWRMRHVARLLADGLVRCLRDRPGAPVRLINIGGGPAMDSLNALILVHKEQPQLLAGRSIRILVLDLDLEGPRFGARALAALQGEGGPLDGLAAALDGIEYNWSHPEALRRLLAGLPANAVVVGSSEGGLFEYAADEEIIANLRALHAGTPRDFVIVGPVVRDAATLDPRLRGTEHTPGRPAIRYLGLGTFGRLAAQAGWRIARALDGPMHQVVCLEKT